MKRNPCMTTSISFLRVLSLLAVCAGCSEKPQAVPELRLVNVVRVAIGSTNNDVGYSGEVRARYETNLSFRLAGKIVARNVEVGGLVRTDASIGSHTVSAKCGDAKLSATFTVTEAPAVQEATPTADDVRRKTVIKPKGHIETGGGATAEVTV